MQTFREGFSWVIPDDSSQNVLAFVRKNRKREELLAVVNFSPVIRENYRIGVRPGWYAEVFNSDDPAFGGLVDVMVEGSFTSATGRDCRRAVVSRPPHEAEIVVLCRQGESWELMPRVWGRGLD